MSDNYEYEKQLEKVNSLIIQNENDLAKYSKDSETLFNIKTTMDECIRLLSDSIKGRDASKEYESLSHNNDAEYRKLLQKTENKINDAKRRLEELNAEREKITRWIEEENENENLSDNSN